MSVIGLPEDLKKRLVKTCQPFFEESNLCVVVTE